MRKKMAEVDEHIGKAVSIETEEGIYSGIIHGIDVKNHKIILHRVSLSDGRKLRGLQIFFRDEIKDLNLLDDNPPKSNAEQDISSTNDGHQLNSDGNNGEEDEDTKKQEEENKISISNHEAKDPSDDGIRLINRAPIPPNKYLSGDESFLRNINKGEMMNPPDIKLIDEFGDEFDKAVEYINAQRVVGLAAEGENIGRFGELYLLIIGCIQITYVFDIYKMGESSFSKGLTSVLENNYLLKVIHDCRCLSDCLYHKYDTEMKDIFDTQVGDIIIFKQKRGKLPRDVNGLVPCLYEYLNLEPTRCQFQNVLQRFYKNPNDLIKRPILPSLLKAVAEKVLYLRELRSIQTEQMLAEFLYGVDLYLGEFRDLSANSFKFKKLNKKIPEGFNSLKNVAESRWRMYEKRDKNIESKEKYKKETMIYAARNKDVESESDFRAGWTEGNDFANMYSKRHGKILQRSDSHDEWKNLDGKSHVTGVEVPWRLVGKQNGHDKEANMKEDSTKHSSEAEQSKLKEMKSNIKCGRLHQNDIVDSAGHIRTPMKDNTDVCDFADQKEGAAEQLNSLSEHQGQKTGRQNSKFNRSPPDQFSSPQIITNNRTAQPKEKEDWFDEEFPVLNQENQKTSPKQNYENNNSVFLEKLETTRRDLFRGNGVHGSGSKFLSRGRAKMRQSYSRNAVTLNEFSTAAISDFPKKFLTKDSFAFPSDNDLLETSPIIESDSGPSVGRKVKLQKIKAKD